MQTSIFFKASHLPGVVARSGLFLIFMILCGLIFFTAGSANARAPELAQMDHEVRSQLLDARLAMRDLAPCNMEMLTRLAGMMDRKISNLTQQQRHMFETLQRMALQLNNILSDMEKYIPDGEPNPYLEGLKTGLAATGLIPGVNAISFAAGALIQGMEVYAKQHNADVLNPILEEIMAQADRQVEAFNDAVRISNDITAAMREIAGYQDRIQGFIATFKERCVDGEGGWGDESAEYADESPTDIAQIQPDAKAQMDALDECDYDELTRLARLMDNDIRRMTDAQRQLFGRLLELARQLRETYSDMEQYFPGDVDPAVELGKGALGLLPGSFATGTFVQGLDIVGGSQAASSTKAGIENVTQRANLQVQQFNHLAEQFNAMNAVIGELEGYKRRLLELIRTWEVRCRGRFTDTDTSGYQTPGEGSSVGYDRTEWCTYGSTTTRVPGRPTYIPGESTPGGTGPPGYTPGPWTPGGTPEPVPGGGTPGPGPTPGGTPTGPGRPGITPPPVVPGGGGDDETATPTEDKPLAPPGIFVKAKQAALESDEPQPVVGLVIRLNLTPAPALPIAGNRRDDEGHDQAPVQGLTDAEGTIRLLAPADDDDDEKKQSRQPDRNLESLPLLAMNDKGKVVSDHAGYGQGLPLTLAAADTKAVPRKNVQVLEITIPRQKSYIVKLKVDRARNDWRDPATYLANQALARYLAQSWVEGEHMYVVVNLPMFKAVDLEK